MEKINGEKWDLSDLFESVQSAKFSCALQSLMAEADSFCTYREKLTEDIESDEFMPILAHQELITDRAMRLMEYVMLWFSENTQNSEALSAYAQTESQITEVFNKLLFFTLWWKKISDSAALRLLEESGVYRYFLEELRLTKPYTLSEAEEKIINVKNLTGSSALNNLYEAITNRYVFQFEGQDLTRDSLMVYARSADAQKRKAVYQELYRVYEKDGCILGQIYQNIVRDWYYENVQTRHYTSAIAVRNTANSISDDVINLLLEVCKQNVSLFQRYFEAKRKILGLEKMTRFDIYAPLEPTQEQYNYEEGLQLVYDALDQFDPQFKKMAQSVADQHHIDSEIRFGKRSGAFCATATPDLTPWVLINYQGKISDISTLAHELGHAIHSLCAADKNIFVQQSCLPLAETASTFTEMLFTDLMLSKIEDPKIRLNLIMKQLDDQYATITRQTFFCLFEIEAHDLILQGADVEQINQIYLKNLKDQFGAGIEIPELFKWEWVSIPHIYGSPFYVYAYAFGQLLALSLYEQYRLEGKLFVPKYKALLSAGGSKSPENILKDAGFDFHTAAFWQGGFNALAHRITEIENLLSS